MQKDYQYFILYKVSSVLLITKTINLDDNKIQTTTINIYNVYNLSIYSNIGKYISSLRLFIFLIKKNDKKSENTLLYSSSSLHQSQR